MTRRQPRQLIVLKALRDRPGGTLAQLARDTDQEGKENATWIALKSLMRRGEVAHAYGEIKGPCGGQCFRLTLDGHARLGY